MTNVVHTSDCMQTYTLLTPKLLHHMTNLRILSWLDPMFLPSLFQNNKNLKLVRLYNIINIHPV
jgi:hypothetical protein